MKSSRVLSLMLLGDCLAGYKEMPHVTHSHVSGLSPVPLQKGGGAVF